MYLFLETCLFPIIFIIFFYGLQPEKVSALFFFFFYTVIRGYFFFFFFSNFNIFLNIVILKEKRSLILFFFSLGFLTKLPLFGLHFWLPLAHTEAPSLGSIVLAGLLLKLGGYGLLIVSIVFCMFWKLVLFFFCFLGSLLRCLVCSFQRDGKVLIAYSSVTHINFGFICILFFFCLGKFLNFFIIVTHGIISSLMFWFFGILYYLRYRRSLYFIKGVQFYLFIFFSVICLCNFGFPPFFRCYQEFFFFLVIYRRRFWFFLIFVIYFIVLIYYNIFFCLNVLFKKKKFFIFFLDYYIFIFFILVILNYFLIFLV